MQRLPSSPLPYMRRRWTTNLILSYSALGCLVIASATELKSLHRLACRCSLSGQEQHRRHPHVKNPDGFFAWTILFCF